MLYSCNHSGAGKAGQVDPWGHLSYQEYSRPVTDAVYFPFVCLFK